VSLFGFLIINAWLFTVGSRVTHHERLPLTEGHRTP
jgi:hypothetical protein